MEITEILQVLEHIRSSVRATRAMLADREPTPDRLAILADLDREIQAFEEAAAILRQVLDQGPLPPEKLREMGGEPVYIIEDGRGGHWELSENAEDYLEGRDLREYEKKWEAYPCRIAGIPREAWTGCVCNTKEKSCCTCVSMRCQFCIGRSEYRRGRYCSSCGRPLTEEAWTELEKRLRG